MAAGGVSKRSTSQPVAATARGSAASAQHTYRIPPLDEVALHHLMDERRVMAGVVERASFTDDERARIADLARRLVIDARATTAKLSGIDAFLAEYGLSSDEGVLLMCLAESLLRIPDADTADRLIAEKIAEGQWNRHLGQSNSLWVNASTWGLLLTGAVVKNRDAAGGPVNVLKRLIARSGEPVIRQAVRSAVRLLGDQFVLAATIPEALTKARPYEAKGYRFSYDMLGEAARTEADAKRYFYLYLEAIEAVGAAAGPLASSHRDALMMRPGVSVKLSALHPRFEPGKERRLDAELLPRLQALARAAAAHNVPLTVDAEEQDRLHLTLDLFAKAYCDPQLGNWPGFGIAVQAYGRRTIAVLRWLRRLAELNGRRIPVRLVKGAYWDTEIKLAQEAGLPDYPVLTRKGHADASFLAGVRYLLSEPEAFFPQFGTHNAHAMASAIVAAGRTPFELQRLYGMGEAIYDGVVGGDQPGGRRCGSTRRSDRGRILSPIWFAGCSRMVPIPRSCIA